MGESRNRTGSAMRLVARDIHDAYNDDATRPRIEANRETG
jgi:hypothetical protein